LSKTHLSSERIALLLSLPEPYREHPAFFRGTPEVFLGQIERQMKARFNKRSCVLVGGHAAPIQALKIVDALLRSEGEACLLCGVDSLLNSSDVECLSRAGRLRDMNHPQGVIPGEGAACVLLTRPESTATQLSSIAGWAEAQEPNSVLGDNYSVGDGLAQAIADAAGAAQIAETDIDFRVSDMNGERYRAWESFLAGTRYYRTHRERLPLQLPAMAVGDLGAAASVLNLVVTATSISRGYAPGPIACCESSSAQGSRAAAIVIPAQGAPTPPFRSRHVPT
jgi:3-oxoacyl-[acyl-carrier-protein] synthase-1